MSERGSSNTPLRAVPPAGTAQPPVPTTELFKVELTRNGDRVARLRAVTVADGFAVECEVDAVDGRRADAQPPLTHGFPTQGEAKAFVDEVTTALQYLGCHVRGSA